MPDSAYELPYAERPSKYYRVDVKCRACEEEDTVLLRAVNRGILLSGIELNCGFCGEPCIISNPRVVHTWNIRKKVSWFDMEFNFGEEYRKCLEEFGWVDYRRIEDKWSDAT